MRDLYCSSCKGFSPAHRGRQFRFMVGNFCFWSSHLKKKESLSLHLSRDPLMVFDGLEGVLNKRCSLFVSWQWGEACLCVAFLLFLWVSVGRVALGLW